MNKSITIPDIYIDLINKYITSLDNIKYKDIKDKHLDILINQKITYLNNVTYWAPEIYMYKTRKYLCDLSNYLLDSMNKGDIWASDPDIINIFNSSITKLVNIVNVVNVVKS